MDLAKLKEARSWLRQELDSCLDFWLAHGLDYTHGGVYTCLDRTGDIYSTDKSVWMQGRCAWIFSYLCAVYGVREEWLDAAKSCLDFMEQYCINHEAEGRMYFQVTDDGQPLRQRRYCFSEGFYAIANAEYYGVTGDEACLERARRACKLIYELNNGLIADPTGLGSKVISSTRQGRSLADPMIFLNIMGVMARTDPKHAEEYDTYARECAERIFTLHMKENLSCTLETVGINGEFWHDVSAGRIVNPGHDIECVWFLLEYAKRIGGKQGEKIRDKAETMFNWAINAGWDKEFGGILYFIDCLGRPCEAYEHDMKLWWPHNETLISSLMLYRETKKEPYLDWFFKTLDYCMRFFSDPEYGEWYGYLRRDGMPTMPSSKGSTFKGPFHLPRCLIMCDRMIAELTGE